MAHEVSIVCISATGQVYERRVLGNVDMGKGLNLAADAAQRRVVDGMMTDNGLSRVSYFDTDVESDPDVIRCKVVRKEI